MQTELIILAGLIFASGALSLPLTRMLVSNVAFLRHTSGQPPQYEEPPQPLAPEDRHLIRIHEAGHAIAMTAIPSFRKVTRIAVGTRDVRYGVTESIPTGSFERRQVVTITDLEHAIIQCLGGRAAEKLIFGAYSTGDEVDLKNATVIAWTIVTMYGASLNFPNQIFPPDRRIAEYTRVILTVETQMIISHCFATAIAILTENKTVLHALAEKLQEEPLLEGEALDAILASVIPYRASPVKSDMSAN